MIRFPNIRSSSKGAGSKDFISFFFFFFRKPNSTRNNALPVKLIFKGNVIPDVGKFGLHILYTETMQILYLVEENLGPS